MAKQRGTAPPRPARLREPLLAQPVADRADRRRRKIRPALGKLAAKLLGTPRGLALAQAQSRRHQLLLARSAMAVRRPAAVFQPLEALGPITLKPLIAGLAADPELDAELAHHRLLLARRRHKSHLLIHHPGLSPRHRQDPPRRALDLSAMYPVQSVSDLIGSNMRGLLPQLAGAKRRMGCGPLLRAKSDCTTVTANLSSPGSCFRTPSAATRHLPRFAEKGGLAGRLQGSGKPGLG